FAPHFHVIRNFDCKVALTLSRFYQHRGDRRRTSYAVKFLASRRRGNVPMNNMQVTEPIVTRAPEPDWSGWENWLRSHLDIQREVMTEACGEALGLTCQELRDRITPLELKLAELTGAIDILRGTPPPPERDTRALGELLSIERREFGDLLERRTRGFELK